LPEDICRGLSEQAQAFSLEEIFSSFNLLVSAQEMAKRLNSLRIPLEISVIRLAQNKIKTDNPLPARPPKLNKESSKEKAAEERPVTEDDIKEDSRESDTEEAASGLSLDDIKGRWQDIIGNLSKIKMSVATYLNEGNLVSLEANTLTVAFPKNYSLHKESLEGKENKLIVEKAVAEALKANLRLSFVLSAEEAPKDRGESSPLLRSILDTFNARTIRGNKDG